MPGGLLLYSYQMNVSISIFQMKGCVSYLYHFYFILWGHSYWSYLNVQTLIRRRDLWRLIWVCNVCLCLIYWTLGTNGLMFMFGCINLGVTLPIISYLYRSTHKNICLRSNARCKHAATGLNKAANIRLHCRFRPRLCDYKVKRGRKHAPTS